MSKSGKTLQKSSYPKTMGNVGCTHAYTTVDLKGKIKISKKGIDSPLRGGSIM